MQAGAGNVPRAGLADAQWAIPQQQNAQRQRTAHSVGKRCAQRCARHAPSQTPDREVLAEYRHLPGGVDEEKLKMMSSTQVKMLMRPGVSASPVERSMAA